VALSPSGRVLLVRFELPTGSFWATLEETGITNVELVGPIWDRTHHFALHGFDGQNELYFFARTVDETIAPQFTEQELLDEGVTTLRWWGVDEIVASSEVFAPRDLGLRLVDLVRDGPPTQPILLADQHPDF